MTSGLTANQLMGRAIGSLFFIGFGMIWLILAFDVSGRLSIEALIGIVLMAAGFAVVAFRLMSYARRFPRVPEDTRRKRLFHWINGGQWIAIVLVVITLNMLHLGVYEVTAIAAIVAVHMFPLARIFRYNMHYATGGMLLLWAIGTLLFVPVEHLQGMTAFGTGAILWLSAATTLALAFLVARDAGSADEAVSV
jgi:hypothetical protein